jgi:hypothetical protein
MSSFYGVVPWTAVLLWAISSVPRASALPLCYTNGVYHSCGGWTYASWGISLGILMLVLIFLGLACFNSHSYAERQEEIARENMAYVANRRGFLTSTYPMAHDPRPPPTQGPGFPRPRPTSLTVPAGDQTYDHANEPQYPATAYPFTGYSVPPPPSHGPSKVHNTVKTKDTP